MGDARWGARRSRVRKSPEGGKRLRFSDWERKSFDFYRSPCSAVASKRGSSSLQAWVLDNGVTAIVMKERQFWSFASLQPSAEKPWSTFMGRPIYVPDMPDDAQKQLGIFDKSVEHQL